MVQGTKGADLARLAVDIAGWRPLALPTLPRLHIRVVTTIFLYLVLVDLSLYHGSDPDYWWHLVTGRIIVQDHTIPRHDLFSWTMSGATWVTHEWLSEAVIYSLDRLLGYLATAVLFTVVGALALVVVHRLVLRLGVSGRLALLLVALGGVASLPYWTVRPQLFTFLFTAVFLRAVFLRYREGRGHLWYLPLLMLLWANLHGGFVTGLTLVAALPVSLLIDRFTLHRKADLREPLAVLVACIGVVAINPNGPDLLAYPVTYLLPGDASRSLISEWQAPNFHVAGHWPLMAALALLVVTGVDRRRGVLPVLLAVLFTFMALNASRSQPLFALVLPVLVGERWAMGRSEDKTSRHIPGGFVWANWLILLVIISVFAVALIPRTTAYDAGRDAPLNGYPQDAAQYVLRNHPDARVFNSYNYGGYLIYAWYPQQMVFVDGRADVYGAEFLNDYSKVTRLSEGWDEILDRYAIDLVLIETDSPLASALRVDPRWEEDFRGTEASVFVRPQSKLERP